MRVNDTTTGDEDNEDINITMPDESSSNSSPWSLAGDSRVGDVVTEHVEPIAIIGMSCRLPGSAQDLSGFWEMIQSGRTAWSSGPGSRFNMSAFQDPSGATAESTNVRGAHFLKGDISAFDAAFFGLNPLEVQAMDPQQRLLLEVAYESFENAGINMESLWGSNTGVYVGQWATDYHEVATRDISSPPKYLVTGTGPAISSNRISYFFNLHGPSFTVDTGCSSSLVALHQAVHSLRSREVSQSFVGGVNLLLDPQRFVYQSKLSMFSTEGRCFSFDTRANGYGRGEGCTGMVLKPLSAALRDGDNIRAVIRNSVVNQDGRTSGLTVPSASAQTEAIVRAYEQILMDPQADYIEAHGTGTKIGDPIEVGAIAAAFKRRSKPNERLPIGSVKGNIGHTEATAGLAGLIKAVLMLEKGVIPPQANFKNVNPEILLDKWKMRIPTRLETGELHRISVNSFGYGGTNAHVIVDEVNHALSSLSLQPQPCGKTSSLPLPEERRYVFLMSAASEKSCQLLCKKLSRYLVTKQSKLDETVLLLRLAYTLGKQSVHAYRLSIVASNIKELLQQLFAVELSPIPKSERSGLPRIAFVFSGQGAQYAQMGRELLKHPTFLLSMEKASQHLIRLGSPWDLLNELRQPSEKSRIDEPVISQPACTAIQLALVDLLAEFNVTPSSVIGHSSGEIAAAYAVKAISFENAMAVSYFRGRVTSELLMDRMHNPGAMLAVGASPDVVAAHIDKTSLEHGQMRVACFNSPRSVTVSGDATAIDELKAAFDASGYFNRKLKTNGAAYHSHHMKGAENPYAAALRGLSQTGQPMETSSRFFSTVTGKELQDFSELSADYWIKNLLSPVLFSQSLTKLIDQSYDGGPLDVVLELGPHSQLGGSVKQVIIDNPSTLGQIKYMSCLTRGKNEEVTVLQSLAQLRVQGFPIPLHQLNKYDVDSPPRLLVDLPPYSFDRNRTFWHESRISNNYRQRKYLPHELLGTLSPDLNSMEPRWRHFLSLKQNPWLKNHLVQGQVVFPAAGYIIMALQAIQQHMHTNTNPARIEHILLRDVSISKALLLNENAPDKEVCLSLRPQPKSARESSSLWSEFRIFSVSPDDKWNEHCRGLIQPVTEPKGACELGPRMRNPVEVDKQCSHSVTSSKFYHLSRQLGLNWQAPFNNISSVRTGTGTSVVTADAIASAAPGGMGDIVHPAVLDSTLFQGYFATLLLENGITSPAVPTFIKDMRVLNKPISAGSKIVSRAVASLNDPYTYDVQMHIGDKHDGYSIIEAQGVMVARLPADAPKQLDDLCYKVDWVPYVDAWRAGHREKLCKSVASPKESLKWAKYLDAVAIHYVQNALVNVALAEIGDSYKQLLPNISNWVGEAASNEILMPSKPQGLGVSGLEAVLLRIGPHLPDILTQKVHPLSLIGSDDLAQVYSSEGDVQCIKQIAEYCHALGRQTPRLKALAVGSGAAAVMRHFLQALNGSDSHYLDKLDVAGPSPEHFETIKEELGSLADVLELRNLDAAEEVSQQGFEKQSYDLIIAAHVVHGPQNIDTVIANLKSLLKPNAKLIVLAVTSEAPHYDLLCRLFTGPGVKSEVDDDVLQIISPNLPRAAWLSKLQAHEFYNPEVCFEDHPETDGGTRSVLVAAAPGTAAPTSTLPMDFVITDSSLSEVSAIEKRLGPIKNAIPESHVSVHRLPTPSPGDNMAIILPEVANRLCHDLDSSWWQNFKAWLLKARAVLLISCNSSDGREDASRGLWLGLARSLRLEHPHIRFVTMHLDHGDIFNNLANHLPALLYHSPVFDLTVPGSETENEFAEIDGQLHVSRVNACTTTSDYIRDIHQLSLPTMSSFLGSNRTLTAELGIPGLLETIRWADDLKVPEIGDNDVRLELRAASINFKDVLIAAGQLPGITSMRNDCSGVVLDVGANMQHRFKRGDRVMALYSRSYTNYPVVHGDCCEVVPENLSFEEAASVPIVWATVYYSLVDMGRLTKSDKILIHSAAGAVGQAAIMLAQHIGAEIFVTVSSPGKRELLQSRFGIPNDHIFSSRTTAFFHGIREMTRDYGVDVVLNSLSGEMFRYSCNLVAPFGRFVEIGRKELMNDSLMPMAFLLKNISFSYVDLALIIDVNKPLARKVLREAVALLATRSIQPVMLTSMPISDIEAAFRLIQAGKHTGKIILRVEDKQTVKALPPVPHMAKFKPNATYAVIGGLGGIGRAVTKWMVDNGAKHILSISRSGVKADNEEFVQEMEARGVNMHTAKCDVASESGIASIARQFKEKAGLYPIRGIVQSSAVFEDTLFEQMSAENWSTVLGPKVQGTKNLNSCFREDVDFFVVLSSICSVCGNDGQANYAAACCFQDELMRQRAAAGLHAFSINIGPVSDVGWLSERPAAAREIQRRGLGSVSISQVLAMLNHAITHEPHKGDPDSSVCAISPRPYSEDASGRGKDRDLRFTHIVSRDAASSRAMNADADDAIQQLGRAGTLEKAVDIICTSLLRQLGKLIATPEDMLSDKNSLDHYGVDSLIAVEIRNWIVAYLQADLSLMSIRGTSSIRELAKLIAAESPLVGSY